MAITPVHSQIPGPYDKDAHYMYGNMNSQPYPPYYNSSWYHREPPRRMLSSLLEFFDDGSMYIAPDYRSANSGGIGTIARAPVATNIINIETLVLKSLRIKLYAIKEEDDIDILLELGKGYSITYITEEGMKVATGVLKIIDNSIPDTCTRFIGEFNNTVATAWIGLDCSTAGKSDKRKIFIASIRGIEEADIEDPDYNPPQVDYTDGYKLNALFKALPGITDKIDQILIKVADNDEIMDKLNEMDVTEKLTYLVEKFETNSDIIINKLHEIDNSINDKFNEIIAKLGAMPYDDKINYLVNKIQESYTSDETHESVMDKLNSQIEKINYIKEAIENGFVFSFLED